METKNDEQPSENKANTSTADKELVSKRALENEKVKKKSEEQLSENKVSASTSNKDLVSKRKLEIEKMESKNDELSVNKASCSTSDKELVSKRKCEKVKKTNDKQLSGNKESSRTADKELVSKQEPKCEKVKETNNKQPSENKACSSKPGKELVSKREKRSEKVMKTSHGNETSTSADSHKLIPKQKPVQEYMSQKRKSASVSPESTSTTNDEKSQDLELECKKTDKENDEQPFGNEASTSKECKQVLPNRITYRIYCGGPEPANKKMKKANGDTSVSKEEKSQQDSMDEREKKLGMQQKRTRESAYKKIKKANSDASTDSVKKKEEGKSRQYLSLEQDKNKSTRESVYKKMKAGISDASTGRVRTPEEGKSHQDLKQEQEKKVNMPQKPIQKPVCKKMKNTSIDTLNDIANITDEQKSDGDLALQREKILDLLQLLESKEKEKTTDKQTSEAETSLSASRKEFALVQALEEEKKDKPKDKGPSENKSNLQQSTANKKVIPKQNSSKGPVCKERKKANGDASSGSVSSREEDTFQQNFAHEQEEELSKPQKPIQEPACKKIKNENFDASVDSTSTTNEEKSHQDVVHEPHLDEIEPEKEPDTLQKPVIESMCKKMKNANCDASVDSASKTNEGKSCQGLAHEPDNQPDMLQKQVQEPVCEKMIDSNGKAPSESESSTDEGKCEKEGKLKSAKEQGIVRRHPIIWRGILALKNDHATVQMHYVSGNVNIARSSLPNVYFEPSPLRIEKRMRMDCQQLEEMKQKLQVVKEHCVLLALPYGEDETDFALQTSVLRDGIIRYLKRKSVAGIISAAQHGTQQPSFVFHIFPTCEFTLSNLTNTAPEFFKLIGSIAHLVIVIATV